MDKKLKNSEEVLGLLQSSKVARKNIARMDFFSFLFIHFSRYLTYMLAPMHREIIDILQNDTIKHAVIMAFRGSGKSTIISTAYPIWAILGEQKKKYVLIICKTKPQAKQMMKNIKSELESNDLLKKDLGPFEDDSSEWGAESIVFTKQGARISIASMEQSIKGTRHRQYRPDVIILDDVEDNESVKTKEGRNKTYEKYTRDIVPLGDKDTRIILLGNMLHNDSLLMRISQNIPEGDPEKIFRKYPIIDESNKILWKGKYPDFDAIEKEQKKINDDSAWNLEYLLKMISGKDQIIKNDQIHFYSELPHIFPKDYISKKVIVGVDLAISKSDTADYTALVPILVYKLKDGYHIYVLPRILHSKYNFAETCGAIIELNRMLKIGYTQDVTFVVESVGYQDSVIQNVRAITKDYIRVVGRSVHFDKETRLRICQPHFKNENISFPETEAENLINEILGFGKERHDDLVDALTIGLLYANEHVLNPLTVICV